MYVHYQGVDFDTRASLPMDGSWAQAVLSDWVGLLTGTIAATSGLSQWADQASCSIQGTVGDWEIYDTDAHPRYPGAGKVLRRLCVDGTTHQYLFLAFRNQPYSTYEWLYGTIGFMGGWDTVNKTPTTDMVLTSETSNLPAGSDLTTHSYMDLSHSNSTSYASGVVNTPIWDMTGSQSNPPVGYTLLNTPALFVF